MTDGRARRLAWSAFGLWLLFVVGSIALDLAIKRRPGYVGSSDLALAAITASFPVAAILILARQPRNRIGWILMAIGIAWALPFGSYGAFAYSRGIAGGEVALAISEPTWAPPIVLMGTTLLLRFPNGRLLSPRWRKVEWAAGVALVATFVAILFAPGKLVESSFPNLRNPLGIEALKPVLTVLIPLVLLIPITIVASAFSLFLRFRRSEGIERLQLKWFTTAAGFVTLTYLIAMVASINYGWEDSAKSPGWVSFVQHLAVFSFILIPLAVGVAVLRYRLYDVDVVINKTVVYGALAVFITAVYVGIVVGIGTLIGQGDRPNLGLSILATAVVAIAFQPVRERVQRFANRLVYGKRATPYEVLSHFAERMASTYAADELVPQMARVLAEGTGSARAYVWLNVGGELRVTGTWPADAGGSFERVVLDGDGADLPALPNSDLWVPVRDRGEMLGALSIAKTRAESATEADRKLLTDLASQAGLVLRNVKLIEELRASRQRIVSAQDEERRKIERNIHDGAQQQLVALNVKLGLARTLAGRDVQKTEDLVGQLQRETVDALENLRDLARGIYPPLLADSGLVAALEAQARKATLPVRVQTDSIRRFPRETEAAVYFCVLEALQNIAKYANASEAVVRVNHDEGTLTFQVEDNGQGFDQTAVKPGSGITNMTDRIEALGGTLEIRSAPGSGTTLTGSVRVEAVEGTKTLELV